MIERKRERSREDLTTTFFFFRRATKEKKRKKKKRKNQPIIDRAWQAEANGIINFIITK